MSTSLPSGTAKYTRRGVEFRARNLDDKENWVMRQHHRTTGSFTADVNFDTKTIAVKSIVVTDGSNERAFTAGITGSSFNGKWTSDARLCNRRILR